MGRDDIRSGDFYCHCGNQPYGVSGLCTRDRLRPDSVAAVWSVGGSSAHGDGYFQRGVWLLGGGTDRVAASDEHSPHCQWHREPSGTEGVIQRITGEML